jgi:hypothetical protein
VLLILRIVWLLPVEVVLPYLTPRADFSGVKVHTDAQSDQLNRSIQAKAFTTGQDVFFRAGAYQPGSRAGQELIAHELTHVVQQTQGLARSTATRYVAPVIQRDILIGNVQYKPRDEKLIDDIYELVKPYIVQWQELDNIFGQSTIAKNKEEKTDYLDKNEENVKSLRNDVMAMLRKYNDIKTFDNNQGLARQVVQDIKLRLLGMEKVIGVDHQDGQFSKTLDDPSVGRTGKTKILRIYRTTHAESWDKYTKSNDLGDILYGHGGSLGQAMHYFSMSKRDKKNDVLIEFKFSNTAQKLMNYEHITSPGGGEGGGPVNGKLTGKSEQNDILALDKSIFSVHLSHSKALINKLNPQVKLIDRVI